MSETPQATPVDDAGQVANPNPADGSGETAPPDPAQASQDTAQDAAQPSSGTPAQTDAADGSGGQQEAQAATQASGTVGSGQTLDDQSDNLTSGETPANTQQPVPNVHANAVSGLDHEPLGTGGQCGQQEAQSSDDEGAPGEGETPQA